MITAQLIGFDKAAKRLLMLNPAISARVVPVIRESTEQMKAIALGLVPRKSGELAATLRTRFSAKGFVGYLDAGYGILPRRKKGVTGKLAGIRRRKELLNSKTPGVYAPVVEFGSQRSKPSPFMIPALEQVRGKHAERITDAIKQGIEDIARTSGSTDLKSTVLVINEEAA